MSITEYERKICEKYKKIDDKGIAHCFEYPLLKNGCNFIFMLKADMATPLWHKPENEEYMKN